MKDHRVLSGVRATGRLHLGNLLGAVRQWVKEQDVRDCFYFIADLHGLTEVDSTHNGTKFNNERLRTAASFLAAGLDPEKVTLFFQSAVPQHTELMWYLAAVARKGELERMTQWKDKAGPNQTGASAGLFVYPVLMAADILLYDASEVPVGDDQRQHVETTRDWAERFNSYFGPTFVIPRATIPAEAARIMDLQNPLRKMSKTSPSDLGTVFLDDSSDVVRDKIRRAVTDSGTSVNPDGCTAGIANLLEIYVAVSAVDPQEAAIQFSGTPYGKFKDAIADAVIATTDPIRNRIAELMTDPKHLRSILSEGSGVASQVAEATCARARTVLGLG